MSLRIFKFTGSTMLVLGALAALPAMAGATLVIHTEENKPLNFKAPNGQIRGVVAEVVQEIQKRIGDTSPIALGDWDSGYDQTLKQPGHMLFATARTEDREKAFKWVGPLTDVKTFFYASPKSGLTVASLDDARKLTRVGVPKKFYYSQFLADQKFTNLVTTESPKELIEMFRDDKIQVFACQNLAISYLLADNGLTMQSVKPLFSFMPVKHHYLAFNIKTSDEVIHQWQKALDDLKADGTFKTIFAKYNLSPDAMPQ